QRALVGLDMRPIGEARRLAGGLHPRDVALDLVHVDHGGRRAIVAGDPCGEWRGHGAALSISSRSIWSSSHWSSASCSFCCAVAIAPEAASNLLRSLA